MNHSQLTQAVTEQVAADGGSISKQDVAGVLAALAGVVQARLKAGEEVTLAGIGKLKVQDKAEKAGRNPSTNEAITIPARRVAKFVPAKVLKEVVAL